MAGVAFALPSYGDSARKEDVVLNAIEILTARETQIFNMLGKTAARDTVHSYLVDTLASPASNAHEETSDYTYTQRGTPTRQTNIIQILTTPIRVSNTQREIEHYHGQDELARQMSKGLMEFANDAEYNLLHSTLTSGVSGTTAPKMSKQYGKKLCEMWNEKAELLRQTLLEMLLGNQTTSCQCV